MTTDTITTLGQELLDFGDLKVWSVLVTLLGDLVSEPDAQISGPVLNALMDRINIRPEALRVALHRLRKDGWVTTTRNGRISHYGMTNHARVETDRVRRLVYSRKIETAPKWYLLVMPSDAGHGLPLRKGLWITDTPPAGDPAALCAGIETDPLPDWVIDDVLTPDLRRSYRLLAGLVAGGVIDGMSAEDQYVLRLLALHHWRRMVLRHPPLVAAFLAQSDEIAGYRAAIVDFLQAIPLLEEI